MTLFDVLKEIYKNYPNLMDAIEGISYNGTPDSFKLEFFYTDDVDADYDVEYEIHLYDSDDPHDEQVILCLNKFKGNIVPNEIISIYNKIKLCWENRD